ncbi:dipeptidyl peptidase III [Myxozyma melibiosi]|uniref:Dipeptidyl peptidase 3 n=1 Tax=Myxozyma melibiosi TaxID=54550 RepID=A0ABR1F086_9ASCO
MLARRSLCRRLPLWYATLTTSPQPATSSSTLSSSYSSASTMTAPDHLLADAKPPIIFLSAKPHFEALSQTEKLYAHHFSKAAHFGTRVVLRQVSPYSEAIFDLILAFHSALSPAGGIRAALTSDATLSADEATQLLEYFSQFLSNLGEYKSFGDIKFVPRLPADSFARAAERAGVAEQFEALRVPIYSTEPAAATLLGYPESGHVTGYYPRAAGDVSKAEVEAIHDAIGGVLLPENTRVSKVGEDEYKLLIASATRTPSIRDGGETTEYPVPSISKTAKVVVEYGDHAVEMGKIAGELAKAKEYAANEKQAAMLDAYVKSFEQGSMQEHKRSQREWIGDIGPAVETNIGFIETYRDPAGIRGEWEGLVAMVNKERTKTFGALVDGAKEYIGLLPWAKDFEKDVFTPPDFTSLEVMTFAGSGIPAGINIPNYDDIRQTIGFKNVSLGNVLNAKSSGEKTPFIRDCDAELYEKLRGPAFELQVGLHELLGHGSGKLLSETEAGKFNFDVSKPPVSPIDGKPVTTYYKPGQTWGSVFGTTAGAYEECRAECVAMYLCPEPALLEIFGHTATSTEVGLADDVVYIAYLLMARAGLSALEFWDPQTKKWGQPHMQARFSILKQFLEAGDGFVELRTAEEDMSDLEIVMDRSKIATHGRKAVGAYLQKLHVYKSSADAERGKALFAQTSEVTPELAKLRPIVMKKKLPRRLLVQGNTFVKEDGGVEYREYEESAEGMIQSFAEREV